MQSANRDSVYGIQPNRPPAFLLFAKAPLPALNDADQAMRSAQLTGFALPAGPSPYPGNAQTLRLCRTATAPNIIRSRSVGCRSLRFHRSMSHPTRPVTCPQLLNVSSQSSARTDSIPHCHPLYAGCSRHSGNGQRTIGNGYPTFRERHGRHFGNASPILQERRSSPDSPSSASFSALEPRVTL